MRRAITLILVLATLTLLLFPAMPVINAGAEANVVTEKLSFDDPVGDDKGPGTLKYPTNPVFKPGVFDIVKFKVLEDSDYIYLRTTFHDYGGNPWNGPNGFSLQLIHVYILTTDLTIPKNFTAPGLNVIVSHGWHYLAVAAPGWGGAPWPEGEAGALYASDGSLITGEDGVKLDVYYVEENSVEIKISKNLLADVGNLEAWVFAVVVASYDGPGPMRVRQVVPGDPQEWLLGGGDPQAILAGVQPLVVDMLAPTAEDQYALLSLYDPKTGRLALIAGMSKYGFMAPLIMMIPVEVEKYVTITERIVQTTVKTETITTTVVQPDYTLAGVIGGVAVLIIAVLAFMLYKKKKP